MPDRQVIEWDKDNIDALKFMTIDCLAIGMLTCTKRAFDFLANARKTKIIIENRQMVAVAGAGGDLGGRIVTALIARGATVRPLIRSGLASDDCSRIASGGATVVAADPADGRALPAPWKVRTASCRPSAD
jgi:hypothetical protein